MVFNDLGRLQGLTLVLFSWDSELDRNLTREIASGNQVIWDPYFQNLAGPWNHIPDQNNAGGQGASSSGASEESVNNFGAGAVAWSGNAGGNNQAPANTFSAPATAGINPPPTCGDPCYGPINSCDPLTGCSCIADPLSSPSSAMYMGRCGVVYTSAATRGRRLSSLDFPARSGNNASSSVAGDGALVNIPLTQIGATPPALVGDAACPCNCTYVSHACCASLDGVVRESPQLRLGMLKVPPGKICDQRSGRVIDAVTSRRRNS